MKNILEAKPVEEVILREKKVISYIDKNDIYDKEILNIGCGWGWFEIQASKLGAKHITGIEPTEDGIATAVKHVVKDNVSFKIASGIDLPFEDESFDTVTSWEVLEHIPRKTEEKMFSEINRVLRKGGVFYMSTPRATFISKVMDPAWWLIGHRHYSLEQLRTFGNNNGLELVEYNTFADFWELSYTINEYIAKWIFRRGPFMKEWFENKVDQELESDTGRSSIWCKFKKI